MTIDFAKYFAVSLDRVYEVQQDIDQLSMWAEDASESMKIVIDTHVLGTIMPGAADASNIGATAGRISGNVNLGVTTAPAALVPRNAAAGQIDVVDYIVSLGQVLDEQNIPENGRWIVLPAWMSSMIKTSDLRGANVSGDSTSIMRNGRIGMIDRFTIYMSNLLPAGAAAGLVAGEYRIYAGHNMATSFASQLDHVGTVDSERTFGKVLRGLQVYGAKVLNSQGLVEGVVKKV